MYLFKKALKKLLKGLKLEKLGVLDKLMTLGAGFAFLEGLICIGVRAILLKIFYRRTVGVLQTKEFFC